MFATAGSIARVLGPLAVTKIYEKYGTYFMIGSVTSTLTVSLIGTILSYKTLVPHHVRTNDENNIATEPDVGSKLKHSKKEENEMGTGNGGDNYLEEVD